MPWRTIARSLLLGLSVAAVLPGAVGCGGGGGGGTDPVDEEVVTLSSLGEDQRQAFEAWKARPLKACAWTEAFPGLAAAFPDEDGAEAAAAPRIDVARFVEHLATTSGGLPVLQGSSGEVVLFAEPAAASGLRTSARSSTREVNGKRTVFEASARSTDGECVLTLGKEEVFRGLLADHVPAAVAYAPGEAAGAAARLGAVEEAADAAAGSTASIRGRMPGGPLVASALATLAPDAGTLAFLAKHFAISASDAQSLFAPSTESAAQPGAISLLSMSSAAGAVDLSRTTLFAPAQYVYDAEPVAGASPLRALRQTGAARLDLFYAPRLGSADALLRLEATVAVDAGAAGGPTAQLTAIRLGAPQARADAEAVGCFLARNAASGPFATGRTYDDAYAPCRALTTTPTGALAGDPRSIRAVVAEVARRGSKAARYERWDVALVDLVDALLTRGAPLSTLDSQGEFPAVSSRTADLDAFLGAIGDTDAKRALQRPLVALAFSPFFDGRTLTAAQRSDVIGALSKAAVPFRASTAQMLADLLSSDRSTGLAAAACGAGLAEARIAAIDAAAANAADYAYGQGFADRIRGTALQACFTQAELDSVPPAVAAARQQTSEESGQQHGSSWERRHQELIDHALDERWTRDAYAGAADEIAFALASQHAYCDAYATFSERAVCTGGAAAPQWEKWLSAAPGGALDPALDGRYPALARELRQRFEGPLADDAFTRSDLQRAFFDDGLWLTCGSDAFATRRTRLLELLDALQAATSLQKVDLRDELEALLGSGC